MSLTPEPFVIDASDRTAPTAGVFYGWWIVAASFLCLMVSINPVINLAFGVFLPALSEEFGWSRSQAAQGISLAMLGFTLMQPLTGKLIARYGAKRIMLGSAALFGLGLAGIALLVVGRWSFFACTFVCGAVAGGTSPLPHGTIIARWFTRRRGIAMGMVAAGVAAGGVMLPPLVSYVITAHGWRAGFALLGILAPCVTLPLVSLVTRNTPEEVGLQPDGLRLTTQHLASPHPTLSGYTAAEARKSGSFWVLALSLFVAITTLQSSAVHLVPFLLERGFALTQAASVVSFLAAGAFVGMLSSGYLVDRLAARVVALSFFGNAALSLVLLWGVQSWAGTVATVMMLGVSLGAMVQLIPALVSWCFGLRAFGEIYGMLMTAFGLGTVMGPLFGGWLHDAMGSYRQTPLGYFIGVLCAAALMAITQKYAGPEAVAARNNPLHRSSAREKAH